jgi:inosose dehydratase
MHTRRDFLMASALGLAAGAKRGLSLGLPSLDPNAPRRQSFKVGYQLLSWGRCYPIALWHGVRDCAILGYPGIEVEYTVAPLYRGRESEFIAPMRRNDMQLAAIYSSTDLHDPAQAYVNRYNNLIAAKFAQQQGTRVLVLGGFEARERTAVQFREYARQANALGKEILETTGVRIGVHPHYGSLVQDRSAIDRVMETTDPRYFSLCPDVGHLLAGGMDPVEVIRTYAERIIHVHLKDYQPPTAPGTFGKFLELGQGKVDLPGVVHELIRIGYSGWADVELDGAVDPAASALRNRDYITRVLKVSLTGVSKEDRS